MSRDSFKDGPMACPSGDTSAFLEELDTSREICLELLHEHTSTFTDTPWQTQDGEGQKPTTDFERASLKLVTDVVQQNDKIIFPPPNTRLSDELVYMATKMLKGSERAEKYPYDFLPRGDIHPDRVPSGVGPLVWAHGLPFFPVYKGYYILTGRQHADWVGWQLQPKSFQQMKNWPIWTIGPVVAPGSTVDLPRTINRQAHLWKVLSARYCEKGMEKNAPARDIVSKAHQDLAIVPDDEGGFVLTQIYNVPGYHIRCGPNQAIGPRSDYIQRSFFTKNGVTDFNYNAALAKPYSNTRHPRISEEDRLEDEDEDEEAEDTVDADDEKESDSKEEDTEDQAHSDSDDGKSVTRDDAIKTQNSQASQETVVHVVTSTQADDMDVEQSQVITKDGGDAKTAIDAKADDAMDTDDVPTGAKDAKAVGNAETQDVSIKTEDAEVIAKEGDDAQTADDVQADDAMDTDDVPAAAKVSGDVETKDVATQTEDYQDVATQTEDYQADSKDAGEAKATNDVKTGDAMDTDDVPTNAKEAGDAQTADDAKTADVKTDDAMDTDDTSSGPKETAVHLHDDSIKTEDAQTLAKEESVEVQDVTMKTEDVQIKEQKVKATDYTRTPHILTVKVHRATQTTAAIKTEDTTLDTPMAESSAETTEIAKDIKTTADSVKTENDSTQREDTPMAEAPIKIEPETEDAVGSNPQ